MTARRGRFGAPVLTGRRPQPNKVADTKSSRREQISIVMSTRHFNDIGKYVLDHIFFSRSNRPVADSCRHRADVRPPGAPGVPDLTRPEFPESSSMSNAIHQEVEFKTSPQRVYEALLDAKQFSAFTGAPAEIERVAGGEFSCFGGVVTGRNIEIVPSKRIVQAWRIKMCPEGVYSLVAFELEPKGSGTRLTMVHDAFPDTMRAHLNGEMPEGGWRRQYWEPLQKYLG
jgi:uncharacterized protein YndB with AHSA1/START domain